MATWRREGGGTRKTTAGAATKCVAVQRNKSAGAQSGGTGGRGHLRYRENKRWEKNQQRKSDRERKLNTALWCAKASIFIISLLLWVSRIKKGASRPDTESMYTMSVLLMRRNHVHPQACAQPALQSSTQQLESQVDLFNCVFMERWLSSLLMCHHLLRETSTGLQRPLTAFQ